MCPGGGSSRSWIAKDDCPLLGEEHRVKALRLEGDQCVSIGNLLVSDTLPRRMVEGYLADPKAHFADRLLAALDAGLDAGGEINPVRSATLLVAEGSTSPRSTCALTITTTLLANCGGSGRIRNEVDNFVLRVLDPDKAV